MIVMVLLPLFFSFDLLRFQFVISCDEDGNLALGDDSNLEAGEIEHVDNDEETDGACVICLEPFRVGELVAWSKNSEGETECLHVWHDCCIQEWLRNVKHDDCPSCRSVILFGNDEDSAETNLGESNQGVFRIIDGLISRATRRASKSLSTGIAFKNSVEIPEELLKQPISFRKVFSSGAAEYLKSKKDTENESLLIGTKRQQRRHTLSSEFFDEKCHSHEH